MREQPRRIKCDAAHYPAVVRGGCKGGRLPDRRRVLGGRPAGRPGALLFLHGLRQQQHRVVRKVRVCRGHGAVCGRRGRGKGRRGKPQADVAQDGRGRGRHVRVDGKAVRRLERERDQRGLPGQRGGRRRVSGSRSRRVPGRRRALRPCAPGAVPEKPPHVGGLRDRVAYVPLRAGKVSMRQGMGGQGLKGAGAAYVQHCNLVPLQPAAGQPGGGRVHALGDRGPKAARLLRRRERDRPQGQAVGRPVRVLGKGHSGEPQGVVVGLDDGYDGGHALLGHDLARHGGGGYGRGRGHAEDRLAGGRDCFSVDDAGRDDRRAGRQRGRGIGKRGSRGGAHVCVGRRPRVVRGTEYDPVPAGSAAGGKEGAHDGPAL